ncbi:MAG: DNA polymerase III subunit chi [Legionellaceae bacterium]|nr:DNA polymerase III subunit chi [Legionellaceae bacterium]HAF86974.1 DNA polymerase III subunit chi [Legionellales bacterium]HCA89508.1 DNA polymerase III subunit chi [Legionellales bacterium]
MLMRVDFYLLPTDSSDDKDLFICRLLEKIYHRHHEVFVACDTQQEAHVLDELLWTFKPESFIPHNLQHEGPDIPPPIQFGYDAKPPARFNDILLNLQPQVPDFYARFKRIIEIVPNDASAKDLSRQRFRWHRAKQHQIQTHTIE